MNKIVLCLFTALVLVGCQKQADGSASDAPKAGQEALHADDHGHDHGDGHKHEHGKDHEHGDGHEHGKGHEHGENHAKADGEHAGCDKHAALAAAGAECDCEGCDKSKCEKGECKGDCAGCEKACAKHADCKGKDGADCAHHKAGDKPCDCKGKEGKECDHHKGDAAATAYGAAISDAAITPLADIIKDPKSFAGKTIKTEGQIARVCQQAGCWMELKTEGADAVRVPFAGHDFFIPKDSSGKHATIEGKVELQKLADDVKEHLESEGAKATGSALQITANGVALK